MMGPIKHLGANESSRVQPYNRYESAFLAIELSSKNGS